MDSIERIKEECKKREIPISKLEKECGFSNGYIGKLRAGTMPADRLQRVADFLHVTYHYLLTGNVENQADAVPLALTEGELLALFRQLSPESQAKITGFSHQFRFCRRFCRFTGFLTTKKAPPGNNAGQGMK